MINNRELSPILSYINDRLTRRPFHAYLWAAWVTAFQAILLWHLGTLEHDRLTSEALFFSAIGAVAALLFLGRLVMLLCSPFDREWLFTETPYRNPQPVSVTSLILVRAIPILGLVVIFEFLIF